MRKPSKAAGSERGYVLLWAAFAVAALSWLAGLSLTYSGLLTDRSHADIERLNAAAAGHGAIEELMFTLLTPTDKPILIPASGSTVIGPATVTWSLRPEAERLDINRAESDVIGRFLMTAGLQERTALQLADAIADWRDPDDLHRLNGAERAAYAGRGLPPPANRPFEAVGELAQVLGVTPEIFACLQHRVTLFGSTMTTSGSPLPPQPGDVVRLQLSIQQDGGTRHETRVIRLTGRLDQPYWTLAVSTAKAEVPSCPKV